jgi:hypothetical protein
LLSLHGAVLLVFTQPVAGLQVSVVQALLSLQLRLTPGRHVPLRQESPTVQAFPSLQEAVLLVYAQPVAGAQVSVVQTFPSSQFSAAPPTHVPPLHASLVVQALPSLQGAVLLVCVQPVAGLHESSVHRLPSSQLGPAPPTQAPPEQASPVVQALPSSQAAVLFAWVQPVAGLQASSVQRLASSQFGAAPPTQTPPAQVSVVVQALASSQGAELLVYVQPVAGEQPSVVHTLPSSQFGPAPPTQVPPEQASPVVQALPSSQAVVLFAWVQPVAGLQASSVQTLPSSQFGGGPPAQAPPLHVSLVVQALPSLHGAVLLV